MAKKGHEKTVALLLEEDVDVNAQAGSHHTPLLAASIKGHEEIVQLLLHEPSLNLTVRSEGLTTFQYALETGHAKIARLLLDKDVIRGRQALLDAGLRRSASGPRFAGTVQPLLEKIAETFKGEPGQSLKTGRCQERSQEVNADTP